MAEFTIHNPESMQPPAAKYSYGLEVPPNARWLHISGQIPVDRNGNTPDDFQAQVELAYENVRAVLHSAGMDVSDLVKVNAYLTRAEDIPVYRACRDRFNNDHRPASTLVVVTSLVSPAWRVEIEAVAAQAAGAGEASR
jgi:enamine deaminase RidA (YjgF/YER057c/UK114 family)